jgi:aspartyl-tRNA(Asn)/glutamyl-tRNA(Gln) amidotransferase subunit B
MGDLAGLLKSEGKEISESPVSAENLGRLVASITQSRITSKLAKEILPKMFLSGEAPEAIMRREGLESIRDEDALARIVDEAIAANPKQLDQYRSGKTTVLAFFVGQVMKATRGQADPAAVNKLLREKL